MSSRPEEGKTGDWQRLDALLSEALTIPEAERGQGEAAAARRDAALAESLLRQSPLPAVRDLLRMPPSGRSE